MNKIILFFLLFSLKINSQNIASNFAVINYTFCMKVGNKKVNYNANLKCNPNQSFYQVSSEKSDDTKEEVDGETVFYKGSKQNKDVFYIYDLKLKTLDMICEVGGKDYKVKESLPIMNWILSTDNKEVKRINDYTCNKATLNFRGRNYTAWYTTKIPVSFGPFKFRGLPGLILEIYDEQKDFSWTATKIMYPITLKVDLGFIKKMKPQEITLKKWIEIGDKERDLRDKIFLKKLPKGVVVESISTEEHSVELKYEWEVVEPKKKK